MDGDRGLCHLTLLLCLPRGVCLSFLVAAPLILLVFSTFLVGGNVQTLLCRSWESGELYEVSLSLPPRTPRARGGSEQSKGLGRKWRLEVHEGERCRGMMETAQGSQKITSGRGAGKRVCEPLGHCPVPGQGPPGAAPKPESLFS